MLTLAVDSAVIPLVAIAGGLGVAVIGISAGTIRHVSRTRRQEASRRELAACVAEGTMTPEDAEKALCSTVAPSHRCCCR